METLCVFGTSEQTLLARWSKFTVDFGCVNLDSSGAKTKGRRKMRERKEF